MYEVKQKKVPGNVFVDDEILKLAITRVCK